MSSGKRVWVVSMVRKMRKISIALAKRLSEHHHLDGAIIFAFKDGQYKAVSYGVTAEFCRRLKPVVESAGELVEDVGDTLLDMKV